MNQVFEDRLIGVLLHFSGIIRNTRQTIFFSLKLLEKVSSAVNITLQTIISFLFISDMVA